MRKVGWLVFLIIVLAPVTVSAQLGYRLSSVTVSSGDDPISSGITGIARFTNERNRLVEVAFQHEQAWIVYGQKFGRKSVTGLVGGSVGHFQGAPWGGPIFTLSVPLARVAGQNISVRTLQWPGVFAWEPKDWKNDASPNREKTFKGVLGNVGLDIGPIGLTYSKLNFLEEPWNTLPGISYTTAIRKDLSLTGSATWNSNKEKWLFYVGLNWEPKS